MINIFNPIDNKVIKKLKKLDEEGDYEEILRVENELLKKVKIIENNEPMVFLKDCLDKNIFIELVDLNICVNDEERLFLRKKVVQMLNKAQRKLPKGYHLMIKDAFRSKEMVLKMYNKYFKRIREEKPNLTDKEIDVFIRNKLAMPDDPVPPGHMTGGAVDVVLCDDNGKYINTRDSNSSFLNNPEHQYTFAKKLSPDIKKNRMILYKTLTRVGFSNFFKEYWHYSYGDGY
jgi:zinc D-Ala-D-Ala dipeptidase